MKHYTVMGVKETLYVYGAAHEGDWYIDYEGAEDDSNAQLFSVYEKQEGGGEVWLADFDCRENAELFVKVKKEAENGSNRRNNNDN